jgi:SAM-dependent methyltransferase
VIEVPDHYYRRLYEVETRHWWYRGIERISLALIAGARPSESAVLDAGCGTGGFLRFLIDERQPARACGIDLSLEAIELARRRVPEAELEVASVTKLPFPAGSFDLVVCNDVLQHLSDSDIAEALAELRRVVGEQGTLLVRTNAARKATRANDEWRLFDRAALATALEQAGFRCLRLTHANLLGSLAGRRRRAPRPPGHESLGLPSLASGPRSWLGSGLMAIEARYLRKPGRSLPYGHTLLAVAEPAAKAEARR